MQQDNAAAHGGGLSNLFPDSPEAKKELSLQERMSKMQSRIDTLKQEPLKILENMPLKKIESLGPVEERLAPEYLLHVYSCSKYAKDYMKNMLTVKGLTQSPIFKDALRVGSTIEDLLFIDRQDVLNSAAVERQARRLYTIELALADVSNADQLKTHANWELADNYDLSHLEGNTFHCTAVDDEVKKRLERAATLNKYAFKASEAGKGGKK